MTEFLIYGAFASVIFLGIVLTHLPAGPRRRNWHEVSSADLAAIVRTRKSRNARRPR